MFLYSFHETERMEQNKKKSNYINSSNNIKIVWIRQQTPSSLTKTNIWKIYICCCCCCCRFCYIYSYAREVWGEIRHFRALPTYKLHRYTCIVPSESVEYSSVALHYNHHILNCYECAIQIIFTIAWD